MNTIDEQGINIEQIMQMANMLGSMFKSTESEKKENDLPQYCPIAFDEEIQTQDMKIIKSVIPYMNVSQQKIVGIMVKLMEIQNIIEKKEEEFTVKIQNNENTQWNKDILLAVKPYCSQEKQNMLDVMLRMFELKTILVQIETLKGVL